MKTPAYSVEWLSDPRRGIYTRYTVYTDGSVEVETIPKGMIVVPPYACW